MNLKKIEAYGFKSFADKLTLNFNSGVTCIVGPNGCGKSNVSDAIRWVLGEQSPKNLRGKSMQEVIFNGTTNRKAMGYCEVSLFFDNTERTYAIYADEVIIKRKLFRSGDSEYYINNEQCRLRDILDLFRDTGIGKDGYSVVGQGKIDSFLSAKPEDRRQIFEEAAGISKYKAKRIESQRKLDRTADSLLRIKDKLDVFEDRMGPLRKQSEEALKARELKSRLKIDEINHFIYLSEHNAEERQAVHTKLDKINSSLRNAETEGQKLEQQYLEVQEEIKNTDATYKELNDQKLTLSVELSKKAGLNDLKLQKLDTVKADIARYSGEIREKNAAIIDHTASVEASKKEHIETITVLKNAKEAEEAIEKKFAEVENEVAKRRKEIDVTNEMLLSSADAWGQINGGLSKLKTEIALMEKSVEDNEQALEARKSEQKDAAKKLSDANNEINRLKADREEKKDIKKDIDDQYSGKFADFEDSQDKYNELRETIAKLNSKIEFLEDSKNSFIGYDSAVRVLMGAENDVKSKVLGVIGNVINTPQHFAAAIEIALGGNINNMITENQQDTSFLIDYLKKNHGGIGTFLPLTAMRPRPLEDKYLDALDEEGCYGVAADLVKYDRKFRPAIETLLGRVVVVEDKATAIRLVEKYHSAFRIVTLDGAHYAVSGAVTGGKKQGADTRMLSVEADLNDAKRSLAANKKIMEVLVADMDEYRKTLKDMEANSRVLDGIIAKLDKDIGILEQKQVGYTAENNRLGAEIKRLSDLIEDDKSKIAVNNQLYATESAKIDSTSSAREDTNDLLTKLAQGLKEKEKERDEVNTERTETVLRAKQAENKLTELEKSIAINTKTIERLNGEINDAKIQVSMLSAEQKRIEDELEKLAAEMADNEELVELQKKIDEFDARKVDLNNKQEEIRRAQLKNGEVVSNLSTAKAKAEGTIERIESEMNAAGERVKEEYGLDFDGAMEFRDAEYDDDKGVGEAKVLRRELAKMGDINEKAVEDLAQMNAEYEELKVHFDDITEAKASLEETIRDLTVKMETIFTESFEKIKVNFAEVFTELFDGGRGMLDLDMEKGMSVLDAGIIIAAEPPGKRLTNIDLLSGGERAMTAIAIIFAIIKLHPMPFCVLDEVDAPLDDANADTYAKYLKKFSKDTQFIIISHRKPTMELADDLYGITMQEKGVSKFFTVKLSDALKMAK